MENEFLVSIRRAVAAIRTRGLVFYFLIFVAISSQCAIASAQQSPEKQAREQQYKSCIGGYYNGPRPGRVRYTKDNYLWVVTPEFAQRFCMPEEFVDKNLKGAEAIAYRVVYEPIEQCGWGGESEVCTKRAAHGLEIYYKSDTKMPTVSDTKFSYRALYMLDYSKHLLSTNGINTPSKMKNEQWFNERPGAQSKFSLNSIVLMGVKQSKATWPVAAFRQQIYVEDIMYDYDFVALEGSMGGFSNQRMEKLGMEKFSLVFSQPNDKGELEGKLLTQFAHVVEFPAWFIARMRDIDRAANDKRDQLFKRVLSSTDRLAKP